MAMFEGLSEALGESLGGIAVGVGAALAAPLFMPSLRPVAKQLVKAGIVAGRQARVWVAESSEQWQDLVAEAKAEVEAGTATVETAETNGAKQSAT